MKKGMMESISRAVGDFRHHNHKVDMISLFTECVSVIITFTCPLAPSWRRGPHVANHCVFSSIAENMDMSLYFCLFYLDNLWSMNIVNQCLLFNILNYVLSNIVL